MIGIIIRFKALTGVIKYRKRSQKHFPDKKQSIKGKFVIYSLSCKCMIELYELHPGNHPRP